MIYLLTILLLLAGCDSDEHYSPEEVKAMKSVRDFDVTATILNKRTISNEHTDFIAGDVCWLKRAHLQPLKDEPHTYRVVSTNGYGSTCPNGAIVYVEEEHKP